jgi:hypothetical protein
MAERAPEKRLSSLLAAMVRDLALIRVGPGVYRKQGGQRLKHRRLSPSLKSTVLDGWTPRSLMPS